MVHSTTAPTCTPQSASRPRNKRPSPKLTAESRKRFFSALLPRFSQRYAHVHFPFVSVNGYFHLISGAVVVHHLRKVLLVLHLLIVDGHNQVPTQHDGSVPEIGPLGTRAQPSLIGGPARSDLDDEQSVVDGQADFIR